MLWYDSWPLIEGSVGCKSVAESNCWTCVSGVLPFPSVREGNLKINTATCCSSETTYDCADLFRQIDIFTFVFFSLVIIPASTLCLKAAGSKVSAFFYLKINPVRATLMNSNEIALVFQSVFLWLLIRPGRGRVPLSNPSTLTVNRPWILCKFSLKLGHLKTEGSDVLDFIPAVLRALAGEAMDRHNLLLTTVFAWSDA